MSASYPNERLASQWCAERILTWGALALLVAAFAALYIWLSLARHAAFQSHAFDLGNMDQAVWNTLHGHLLRFTDMQVPGNRVLTTRLAIHVEPLLIPLSLLYLVHSGPETLLVVQAAVVALGAIPAFLLARTVLGWGWPALVFPLAYLLHPSLQNAVLDDFHAVTLSACFLMWALYFLAIRSSAGFAVAALLAMSTKEEIGLLVGILGFILLWRREHILGLAAVIIGFGWFLVSVMVVIPHFNPGHASPYLARYSYLGRGLGGILTGAVRHPGTVVSTLTSASRLHYLSALLSPLGYIPLAGIPILLVAAPSLAVNMLSNDPTMYSGFYQYSAEIIPFLIAGAVLGMRVVGTSSRAQAVLAGLLLLASCVATWQYGFSPLANGFVAPSAGSHQITESRLLGLIPSKAVVAAADEIEPHISDRRTVYLLPTTHPVNGPPAQYLVLDASIPSLPTTPADLHAVMTSALHHGFGVLAADEGILLLKRHAGRRALPPSFFSFLFTRGTHLLPETATWGGLRLVGTAVHPSDGRITASRPSIGLETYWKRTGAMSPRVSITFYTSPVYSGAHPAFSPRWSRSSQSPAWVWLPISSWPAGRIIHAVSLPLLPDILQSGKVDVAVGVQGTGLPRGVGAKERVEGAPRLLRVATVQVGY